MLKVVNHFSLIYLFSKIAVLGKTFIIYFDKNVMNYLVCQHWRSIAKIVWATKPQIITRTRKKLICLDSLNLTKNY